MPFDRLPPKVRTKIASKGNAALRESGKIYKFSSEKAREAGLKSAMNRRLRAQKLELENQEELNK